MSPSAGSPGSRVLILVENLPVPFDRRVWLEATTLRDAGYNVSVISIRNPGEKKREVLDGIAIYRYLRPPDTHGYVSFVLEVTYCWLMTLWLTSRVAFTRGFDVIHACNPPDTFFAIGRIFRLFGKRFVYDQHDLCPELYLSRFGAEGGSVHRVLLQLERLTYRTADVVLSPNESYRAKALGRGQVPDGKVFVVRTGPDGDRLSPVAPRAELKRGRTHLVLYLGVMNPQDGVDYLLRSIRHFVHENNRQDTHFVLIGKGDATHELSRMARELDIDEFVEFPGRVPDEELRTWLSTADVCASPDPKNPLNDVSTMNKTMEYMAMGKPVVAFDLVETRYSALDAAIYAEPNSEADFSEKIAALLDEPERRIRMGRIGQQRVRDALSWEHTSRELLRAYDVLFAHTGQSSLPGGPYGKEAECP